MKKLGLVGALLVAAPAAAAGITITKSAAPVSDGYSTLGPKALPGATIEYTLVATNPVGNLSTITAVGVCDVLPAQVTLLTADLTTNGGPVAFSQGLTGSGLSYSYVSLASAADGLTFFDSTGAAIATPTAGSDARVRKICVALTGTQMIVAGSFRLRYRGVVR